ncbi:MAG: VOC family protein [Myxococcota bacterium]|nr:VOC family protein [Myxococcota bacterium]
MKYHWWPSGSSAPQPTIAAKLDCRLLQAFSRAEALFYTLKEGTMGLISVRNFSHVSAYVTNLERSLPFYRDALGLEVLFETELAGPGLDAVTQPKGASGRMVGLQVPGGMSIELIQGGRRTGNVEAGHDTMIFSLCVDDLDAAHESLTQAGVEAVQPPTEIAGLRMFFVRDPDGRRIELIEFPGQATCVSEFHGA